MSNYRVVSGLTHSPNREFLAIKITAAAFGVRFSRTDSREGSLEAEVIAGPVSDTLRAVLERAAQKCDSSGVYEPFTISALIEAAVAYGAGLKNSWEMRKGTFADRLVSDILKSVQRYEIYQTSEDPEARSLDHRLLELLEPGAEECTSLSRLLVGAHDVGMEDQSAR